MNKRNSALGETTLFASCELIVAGLTVLGFFVLSLFGVTEFDYKVILGAALGCALIILNYALLCAAVNRAVNNFVELRGDREMSDEESEQFAKEHAASIQKTMQSSMMLRTFSLIGALVIAFLTGVCNPLATAIPMLAFRPLISLIELVRRKYDKAPNPDNFIKYDIDEENKEEKESD